MADVSGHSKVWVLVDGCWNNAGNVGSLAINVRERVAKTRGSLHGREGKLTNVV